ncbi:CvpA family protein [Thermoflavimicrobium dichotomicum]|nr:CvpA family protein [Thermoflavimicrobium dichotomicum]
MNMLDIFLVIYIFFSSIMSYKQGLFLQLYSLLSWFIALWFAYMFNDDLAPDIGSLILPERNGLSLLAVDKLLSSIVAFFLIFLGMKFLLRLFGPIVGQVFKLPVLRQTNQIGGLLIALIKNLIVLILFVHILHLFPWETGQRAVEASWISQGILKITPDLTEGLKSLFLYKNN